MQYANEVKESFIIKENEGNFNEKFYLPSKQKRYIHAMFSILIRCCILDLTPVITQRGLHFPHVEFFKRSNVH